MRFVAVALGGIWLLSQVASAAEPATAPAPATRPVRVRAPAAAVAADPTKAMRDKEQARVTRLQVSGKYKLPEVLQFSLKDGLLQANWAGPNITEQTRVEFEGSAANWLITRAGTMNVGAARGVGQFQLSMMRYEFDRAAQGGPWMETLNVNPTYTNISATYAYGPNQKIYTVSYYQSAGVARLNINCLENGAIRAQLLAPAASLTQLQADHPEEVRKYLAPLLRDFTGVDWLRPGPADVYRVFDQVAPDMKVVARITELLPRLDSEVFSEREAASRELAEMGRPGVLAALRQDSAGLTPEQKGRLSGFVSLYARRTMDPAQGRRDVNFILECLEDEDPAVRSAARDALESVTGRKIALDLNLPGEKLSDAVDALRVDLARATTQPSTKPASEAGGGTLGPVN